MAPTEGQYNRTSPNGSSRRIFWFPGDLKTNDAGRAAVGMTNEDKFIAIGFGILDEGQGFLVPVERGCVNI